MLKIDVDIIGDKKFIKALAHLNSFEAPEAVRKSIRHTASGPAKRVISQKIRDHYKIKAKRVKEDIHRPRFYDGGFEAIINTSYEPITAMQYGWKQKGTGAYFQIFKSGGKIFKKGGFTGIGRGGNALPWVRSGKASLPVYTVYGPSVGGMVTGDSQGGPDIRRSMTKELAEVLRKEITGRTDAMLRGFGRVTG